MRAIDKNKDLSRNCENNAYLRDVINKACYTIGYRTTVYQTTDLLYSPYHITEKPCRECSSYAKN